MRLRLGISVEGQTEEAFVKRLLAPHLDRVGIETTPVPVATSRTASGSKVKGGGINIDRVTHELRRLLDGYSVGLDSMRAACPRFAAWIGRLERLCG